MFHKIISLCFTLSFLLVLGNSIDVTNSGPLKCDSDSLTCVEQDLVKFLDNLEEKSTLPVIGDYVSLVKKDLASLEKPRGANEDIVERCFRFLADHEIRLKLPSEESRSLHADPRSRRLKKMILPIILLLKLKAAIVIPIVLSIIALIAFNGMGAGLVALALSGATALKSLLENHGTSKISYEIVPPISPHWSRAGAGVEAVQPLPLPLSPYTKPYHHE